MDTGTEVAMGTAKFPEDFVTPEERTRCPYVVVGQFLSDEREKDWEAIKRLQDKGFEVIPPRNWR